ncbi:MAG: M48 family metalloprotease [Piscinibacter sp.]|nr:M48 family metalloprotease [Piscinibacter sp.]
MSLPPARPRRCRRRLVTLVFACAAFLHAAWPGVAAAQSPNTLPSLGDPVSDDLSLGMERQIGEQIMREIRRDPDYLDDPVLLEYLQSIWQPLVEAARARGEIGVEIDLRYPFEPFLVRDRSVNAFALPGGFVGVHLGLIAITGSRDELAAVLAHELSHVTQRHIARSIAPSRQASILGVVTTLLGVLAASRSNDPTAARAVMSAGQGVAIQAQLNFSRDMEREADRVGYGVMTQAGYSAGGMAAMFEKLDRASRFNDSGDYPYLRSHPLTIDRIGEARSRSGAGGTLTATGSVMLHAAMQARARVLMDPRNESLRRLEGNIDVAPVDAGASAPRAAGATPPATVQLPDVEVLAALTDRADRLGRAYASALAATLLRNWSRADASLAQALALARAAPPSDAAPLRAVQLLLVQSLLERGDAARATVALDPLTRGAATRPVLLLQSQVALARPDKANQAGQQALRQSADALQTWVATHPGDASAWRMLGQVWTPLGQPLRALRADAEAELALGNLRGAYERLRVAQNQARSGGQVDFIEASVIDARLRVLDAQRRALLAEQAKQGGGPPLQ